MIADAFDRAKRRAFAYFSQPNFAANALQGFPATANDPFPAGAHPLDWRRSGLTGFGKKVCRAFTEALLADDDGRGGLAPPDDATLDRVVHKLDLWLGSSSPELSRAFFVLCAVLQSSPALTLRRPYRFTALSLADRLRVLEKLEDHPNGLFSMLLTAFKVPLATAAFEEGELLASTGFPAPESHRAAPSANGGERLRARSSHGASMNDRGITGVIHGRTLTRPLEESADVVVIGSGAGGAVVAATLAEAGKRVIVVEEGAYYAPEDYQRFAPSESVRRLFREGGMVMAFGIGQTPMISITMGRAVGGSSLLTGGVCFRVPSEVHGRWERELGLAEFSERAFEEAYADVEKKLDVTEVPEAMRSESTRRYVSAAEKLGIPIEPLRRNTGNDCDGNARCNFTCPKGAKRSVDVTYLPAATRRGAMVVSDALATNLIVKNGRAAGVEGRLLGGAFGAPGQRFRIHARAVVTACGTLHTPLLLLRQGIGKASGVVGKHVTLHPAVRIVARFDDPIEGWNGAMQSVYSDHFASEGIKLVGVYTGVNFLAAGLPGVGPKLRERARSLSHCAVFGAMIHDEGGGWVRASPGREPILTYKMAPRDLTRLRKAITILAELSIAAGAREVYTSAWGFPPLTTMDEARRMESASIDARRIECMAFHPLGSARVGLDARSGVVDQRGEAFDLPGLFVADGSVLPTSIGVNSQVPIMATATRIAWRLDERFPS